MPEPPSRQRTISRDEAPRPEEQARPPVKGRGTVWAIEHRHSRRGGESYDDGWGTLEQSIEGLVRAYPEQTVVYPGHMGVTTLERERDTNPFLAELRSAMHATAAPDAAAAGS